jgi:hypothetical protein
VLPVLDESPDILLEVETTLDPEEDGADIAGDDTDDDDAVADNTEDGDAVGDDTKDVSAASGDVTLKEMLEN